MRQGGAKVSGKQHHFGDTMGHRASRNFGKTRAISLALSILACAAVLYSIYQVAVGHSAFSWAWLVALLPAVYGTWLLGNCALAGRQRAVVQALPEPEAAG